MGQIIIIGGNKGGSAKTATCIQLAVQLAHIGADFLVVNADPQKSMANFVRYHVSHGEISRRIETVPQLIYKRPIHI